MSRGKEAPMDCEYENSPESVFADFTASTPYTKLSALGKASTLPRASAQKIKLHSASFYNEAPKSALKTKDPFVKGKNPVNQNLRASVQSNPGKSLKKTVKADSDSMDAFSDSSPRKQKRTRTNGKRTGALKFTTLLSQQDFWRYSL